MSIAGEESGSLEEPQVGQTSIGELEGGIFNMMITLVKLRMGEGRSKSQACNLVADMLTQYVEALRKME